MPSPPPTLVPGPPETLCLDFANTRYWRGMPSPTDDLDTPDALRRWCSLPCPTPPLGQAIVLREALYAVFAALAEAAAPPKPALAMLEAAVAAAPPRLRLLPTGAGFAWEVAPRDAAPASLLAGVLWSAGDLLAGPRRAKLRRCENPQCRYLFLDDSRAGNRRWCSMASCGNRAKAHRHYARRKQQG